MEGLETQAWGVVQREYNAEKKEELATFFTIGNGLLGLRGSEPEDKGRLPAMLLYADTLSRRLHSRDETDPKNVLANPEWFKKPPEEQDFYLCHWTILPAPLSIDLVACGKKFHPSLKSVTAYERRLDFKSATVSRKVKWQPVNGVTLEVESRYFVGLERSHLVLMRYAVRVLEGKAPIELSSGIYPSEMNSWTVEADADVGNFGAGIYFASKAAGTGVNISLAAAQSANGPTGKLAAKLQKGKGGIAQKFASMLSAGQEIMLEKFVAIATDADGPDCLSFAKRQAADAMAAGLQKLETQHLDEWGRRWDAADVEVEGDVGLQQGIRFSIYHLLIAEPPAGRSLSISARTLSGPHYRGVIFWDTELFVVPLFQYARPEAARRLLKYRGDRVDAMRTLAAEFGLPGARAPWESNPDGSESTEPWMRHQFSQLHVTADIALAVYRYIEATGDLDALKDGLLAFMLESARFWAARVSKKGEDGRYELLRVCGPDEDHPVVDNSFYTSYLVRWHLLHAIKLLAEAREAMPDFAASLTRRIGLAEDEVDKWTEIAGKLCVQQPNVKGVIEQFEGYFDMPDGTKDCRKAEHDQTIKQPDVVMLLRLFLDAFPQDVLRATYLYYEPRTMHGSSLGAGVLALVAARVGLLDELRKYLRMSARLDLDEVFSPARGIHAACCGVTYSAVVEGIAGVFLKRDAVLVEPIEFPDFQRIAFNFFWHGRQIRFEMADGSVRLRLLDKKGEAPIVFRGKPYTLKPDQLFEARL